MDSIYKKGWFKAATYWVAGYFLFFVLVWGLVASGVDLGLGFLVIFGIHLLTMLLALVLTVLYVVHALQNPFLETSGKLIWLVVLLSCGPLLMPLYYQRHVTRV